MGQSEVIKFLESCDKPVTRKQIAEGLQEDAVKISHILANLLKWMEVEFLEYTSEQIKEIAGYAPGRRTRVYFIKREIKIRKK